MVSSPCLKSILAPWSEKYMVTYLETNRSMHGVPLAFHNARNTETFRIIVLLESLTFRDCVSFIIFTDELIAINDK